MGKRAPQHPDDFVQTAADAFGRIGQKLLAVVQQAGGGHGHHDPVDWFTAAVAGKQGEKFGPFLLVAAFVHGNGVPACRIQKNGLVKEPPVAVARTGNARRGAYFREGGGQAGALDGRCLAGAGFAQNHVPGNGVQRIAERLEVRAAEHLDGFLPALLKVAHVLAVLHRGAEDGCLVFLDDAAHEFFLASSDQPFAHQSHGRDDAQQPAVDRTAQPQGPLPPLHEQPDAHGQQAEQQKPDEDFQDRVEVFHHVWFRRFFFKPRRASAQAACSARSDNRCRVPTGATPAL